MKYTKVHEPIKQELKYLLAQPYTQELCKKNPSFFAKEILNITPYNYQHLILRRFREGVKPSKRIIICKSRQIGMSICMALLSIWACAYNKFPSGIDKNTKIGIVSRDDKASKNLMRIIHNMCFRANKGFIGMIITDIKEAPLNKSEINFKNKCYIRCYPPTESVRGQTFDIVIEDESAFIDDNIHKEVIEPTVSFTDGIIILSSTPNGQKGFYFETFDPEDTRKKHEYRRYWFQWKVCQNPVQRKLIIKKQKYEKETGNYKKFMQEYEARFTVDEEAFFEDSDINKMIDNSITELYEYRDNKCALGIDYGMTQSATVLTVVSFIDKKIQLLFQFAQKNFDENKLLDESFEHSIQNMLKRYNLSWIVVDDCPQGNMCNREMENRGYPVLRFDFKSDRKLGERNRGLYVFRSAMKKYNLKIPNLRSLVAELKTMQETRLEGDFMKIKAPKGLNDDRVMSFMMSCYPFLMNEDNFSSSVVEHSDVQPLQTHDGRHDSEWEKWKNQV